MYLRGWALVPTEFARSYMPQWLKQRSCVVSPLGSFTDIAIVSPATMKRSFSGRQKNLVIERDGKCCIKCGSTDLLTMQHVRPFSQGGETTSRNLVTLCFGCNQEMGDVFDVNLYEAAGLMHEVDPSLIRYGQVSEVSYRRALQLTKNLMVTRCEVW
ncbi:HNH endonuclease [Rhodanobacter soli]